LPGIITHHAPTISELFFIFAIRESLILGSEKPDLKYNWIKKKAVPHTDGVITAFQ